MARFTYKAKRGPEEVVQGAVEANDRDQAVRRVSEMGYFPLEIREVKESPMSSAGVALPRGGRTQAPTLSLPRLFGTISSREVTTFTRQLASLFRSQIPILRILSLLRDRTSNPKMKQLINSLHEDVKGGKPLSMGLEQFPKLFAPFYRGMVCSGELSGKLEEILDQLSWFREKEEEFRSRIRSAMAYPLFLLITGALTIAVLLTVVLPRLLSLFEEMKTDLPLPTQILMDLSHFFSRAWPVFLGIAILLAIALSMKGVQRSCKKMLDRAKLGLPVVRPLVLGSDLERFTRTLALLLKSGLPAPQAVEASVSTLENDRIRTELAGIKDQMIGGSSLSEALTKVPSLPAFVRDMIAVGEESGRLSDILEEIAQSYVREIEERTKIVTSLLEPMIILVLGLVVGFIVAAMLLPIFEMNLAVR